MSNKIATLVVPSENRKVIEGDVHYDMDYTLLEPIVKTLNALGAPITMYDMMELIEAKLDGRVVSGKRDDFLKYTFIFKNKP